MLMNFDEDDTDPQMQNIFDEVVKTLKLSRLGYDIYDVRDLLNGRLSSGSPINKSSVKKWLINHFGDQICITYPKQNNKSQIFFSVDIITTNLAETFQTN